MFGEEHCYVIDAKAYGNCGRYLNVSTSAFPFGFVGLVLRTVPTNTEVFLHSLTTGEKQYGLLKSYPERMLGVAGHFFIDN